jgi:uncharacterized protein YndB with AHSA1/START domain
MEYAKVLEWTDIRAPREEVFQIVTDVTRRLQLSPLWGTATIEAKEEQTLEEGCIYLVRHTGDDSPGFESVITAYDPPRKLGYCLDVDQQTSVTWNLQETANGTRLTYTEEFLVDPDAAEQFTQEVRKIVKSWLMNIRNYAELRDSRIKRFVRWVLDKYYLKMRPEQRNVVAIILFMHITGFIAFVMSALAMGIASLFL